MQKITDPRDFCSQISSGFLWLFIEFRFGEVGKRLQLFFEFFSTSQGGCVCRPAGPQRTPAITTGMMERMTCWRRCMLHANGARLHTSTHIMKWLSQVSVSVQLLPQSVVTTIKKHVLVSQCIQRMTIIYSSKAIHKSCILATSSMPTPLYSNSYQPILLDLWSKINSPLIQRSFI